MQSSNENSSAQIEDLQIVGTEELFEWYGMITHKVNEVQLLQRIILL